VSGMLCVVVEETERVIGERRLATLNTLGAVLSATITVDEVVSALENAVSSNQRDLPFTMTYLFEDGADGRAIARLASCTGMEPGHRAAPDMIDPNAADALWPIDHMIRLRTPLIVENLADRFGKMPCGAWDTPSRSAVIVPIAQQGQSAPAGFLIAGINPYRRFDAAYAGFVDLVAGQIASSLANARAYEAERRRAESLAELDRAKTAFFSNVSHELRTPLTLMLGPTEDLLAGAAGTFTDTQREQLGLLHRNQVRLLKLVNNLLDFSRLEAGRTRANFETTDLGALTTDLASSFRSTMERAGLRFVIDAPALPSNADAAYVDREMWEKVVLNLLSNALKHTFDGEVAVTLGISDDRRHAELRVRDSGVGIAADVLPRVFERFHRVANAKSRTHEGTGIGLALVRELARLHGGDIDAQSEVGAGTTFTVRIPLGHRHLPPDRIGTGGPLGDAGAYVEEAGRWLPTPVSDRSAPAAETTARVLFADDNADMRDYVTPLLRARGWHVDAVSDGEAALAAVRTSGPYDLVLSDVMMPRVDGFALLRAIRADAGTRATPVILLSARAGEEARVEG
ncbi:MAG: ATP-binding response regulator, partial [bacterium]